MINSIKMPKKHSDLFNVNMEIERIARDIMLRRGERFSRHADVSDPVNDYDCHYSADVGRFNPSLEGYQCDNGQREVE